MQVGIEEAKRRMDELIAASLAGEEVVFTRWRKPIARLDPLTAEEKQQRRLQAGAQ
ncbi:MAG TPA: hypothetical protein VF589_05405 [Allosphingosinicella sp.]|jgi:antitoxin (DNA-binding transcriptional repressor) of toxin-antitoxin stability system